MLIKFTPNYIITTKIANCLIRIEAAKERILHLSLSQTVLFHLREMTRIRAVYHSIMLDGNRLNFEQLEALLKYGKHFPGYERDELEAKGYYNALPFIEQLVAQNFQLTEDVIQILHALVITGNNIINFPSACYRDNQTVIHNTRTRTVIYVPPKARDVPDLIEGLIDWTILNRKKIPCAIMAGIVHYQFATTCPYHEGNGRVARLLTNLILHSEGYNLKGLCSLEEFYMRDTDAYYKTLYIGKSNTYYYTEKSDVNITKWIEYFIEGMAVSFEDILKHLSTLDLKNPPEKRTLFRKLGSRQRKILPLFQKFETVTSKQIGELFGFKPRTNSQICKNWVENGFLEIADSSNKGRKYKLAKQYEELII